MGKGASKTFLGNENDNMRVGPRGEIMVRCEPTSLEPPAPASLPLTPPVESVKADTSDEDENDMDGLF